MEALRDLKIPIVTTNYDGLIEEVTKLPAVTWKEKHKIDAKTNKKAMYRL